MKLYDWHIASSHVVSSQGALILNALQEGIDLSGLYRIAAVQNIPPAEIRHMLGELNTCGALIRYRSAAGTIRSVYQTVGDALRGVIYPSITWRRTASTVTIGSAVFRASRPLIAAIILLGGLLGVEGSYSIEQILQGVCFTLVTFLLGATLHEYAHWWFLSVKGLQSSVVQRGLRIGLLHKKINPKDDLLCALVGPLIGCMASGLVFLWPWHFPGLQHIGLFLCVLNLCSLLPFYGDGKSILQFLNTYRKNIYDKTNA